MEKVNLFNCKRKKEFSMGASAKFVLKKKWGLIFFAKLDTKGGSVLGISTAIKTALKVALYDFLDGPPTPLNSQ